MTRAPAAIVLGLLSGMMASAGRAQTPPPITIHGRVLADDTGDPLRNARVGGAGADVAPVVTDADGRFAIAMPPGGRDILSAAKTGYVKAMTPASDRVEFRLTRAGVITGHVLDDAGLPLPLMQMVAQRVVRSAGHPTFETAASVEADDRGEYRIFGLAPGEYVVATAGARETMSPAPADERPLSHYYSHGATAESAQVIRVSAGAEVPGIDILVALPEPGPQFPRSTA